MRGAMYGTSYFQSVLNESDVCLLTEHWLNENNISFLSTFADNFHLIYSIGINCNKTVKGSGGTAILVRKSLNFKIQNLNIINDRMCGVKLCSDKYYDICLICVLLPSTNFSSEVYMNYIDELCTCYDMYSEDCTTIVGGDCNIDLTSMSTSGKLTCFSNFLNDRNLCPAPLLQGRVGPKYTFRSKDLTKRSLLDYICVPEYLSNDIFTLEIKSNCPYEVSDHYPVFVQLNIDLLSRTSNTYNINKKTLKWSNADDFELKMYQTEIDKLLNFETNSDNLSKGDVDRFSSLLINALHMAANSCIPVGTFRPYLKPYWKNQNLNNCHFEQRNARRKWINNNKTRETTDLSYIEYKNKKREFRKRKRIAEKLWQEEKFEDIKLAAEMDIGEFYQRVRRMRKSGPSTTKLSYNGTEATNDSSICELWGEYFRDLYSEQPTECFNETFFHEITSKVQTYFENSDKASIPELEKEITLEEIREQINTLKCGKAPGPDRITNEHILYGGDQVIKCLCTLFNMILKTEYLPVCFRHGIIIPLYKGSNKDKTNPNSYRAVTLTSVLGKLLEKIFLCRIQNVLENINNVVPHGLQFGFVKEHGSIPAIYTLKESIRYYIERCSYVFSIFLDNEKAFDRIWQDGLLFKLWNAGITGKIWKIIHMSFKTATAHVQYNRLNSQVFPIKQGVGQGRVMSAWLFALFINDLITQLLETNCGLMIGHIHIPTILLADDTTLLSGTKSGLQQMLNVVNKYAYTWRLKYNATKSTHLLFKPAKTTIKHNESKYEFCLGETKVPMKQSIIYAGTLIDSNMKSYDRTDKACKKMKMNLHSLYSIGLNRSGMNSITNTTIWKRIVLPTALYSCELWGTLTFAETKMLEQTQRYFVRFVLGLDKRSPTDSCTSTVGLWSIQGLIDKFKLLFLGRLLRAKSNTTHKQLFILRLSQLLLGESDKRSITYDLIKTLTKYDMHSFLESYMDDLYIPDKKLWSKIVNQSIEIREENIWKASIQCRPELCRYYKIQNKLTIHRLLRLAVVYPHLNYKLLVIVKLGSIAIKDGQCSLCGCYSTDVVQHLMLYCENLLDARNSMFYGIVDVLPVQESVRFFQQTDSDIIVTLLGGITDFMQSVNSDNWGNMMCYLADHIFHLYGKFKVELSEHRFNFGH
ncbi:Hypothetical predicted protein [Mytilus galloprovincialis]|uniref:Reverse transcriptase domain-containing protein n=1 Tax=Mytilus galloprovincialis TaxID=29158 RepID=A0A8B6HHB8_MYTGA|nr:Hypothetical predicted protein [Mytilus galloprovincialis]